MSNALDMSLDDIIKSNRKSNTGSNQRGRGGGGGGGRGRGSGSGSGSGPTRRFPNRTGNRAAPYTRPVQAPDSAWQHDMFVNGAVGFAASGGGGSSIETGTKLYISNLDYGVSNEDIKELFSEVGDLKRYGIHYDRSGRSKGTAEVVYSRRSDALAAVKRYNNVQLDGKPMKVEIVGTNLAASVAAPLAVSGMFGNLNGGARRGRGGGGFVGRPRGGFGGGHAGRGAWGGRGRGRGHDEKISADDLDAELDKYHKEAMETS